MTGPFNGTIPVTDEQAETFRAVTSGQYENLACLSVLIDGQPTTAIVAVTRDGEGFDIHPLYLGVTDELFARITPPLDPEEVPA